MSCVNCNEGWIVTCCDDMCRGIGECIHGDGMKPCPCEYGDDPDDDYPEENPQGKDTTDDPRT